MRHDFLMLLRGNFHALLTLACELMGSIGSRSRSGLTYPDICVGLVLNDRSSLLQRALGLKCYMEAFLIDHFAFLYSPSTLQIKCCLDES